jgi:hypothetical protein
MDVFRAYRESGFSARFGSEWLAVASGLWLRAGFVGASALASGFVALFNGGATPAFVLATIVGGGALAAFAIRRGRQALNRLASPAPPRPDGAAAGTTSPFPRSTREAPAR